MKKFILIAVASMSISGCALPTRQPITGIFYSDVKANENVTDNPASSKMGEACAQSILGFASGDASMEAAKKAGGITQVAYVDNYSNSILGVWAKYCLIVHGK